MKKLSILFVAVFIIAATIFTGCTPSTSSSSSSYVMKANISGSTPMNGSICLAAEVSSSLGISGSTVTGGIAGPPQINLSIGTWSGTTGTFPLTNVTSATEGNFGQYISTTGVMAKVSSAGNLVITSVTSTQIKGTFSFTCTDGTVVSAGSFTAQRP
jgi:hypothetical protein